MKKQSNLGRLLDYADKYRILTYLSWILSAVSALIALLPFWYIWRILREIIETAPRYAQAVHVTHYGWMAVLFAVLAVLIYIAGLMCSHLSAFRIATNLRLSMTEHIATLPLGAIEQFGSGRLRRTILADLTSSIMNDCAVLESSQSHYVEPLFGAILSTMLISVSLLFFNWRMALEAIWPLPVAFAIVALASDVQNGLSRRSMAAKIACEDGIQECMEAMPDLRANNAEERYLSGLAAKIRALESRLIQTELGTALFVVSASLVLRLGMATTALAGASLLAAGRLDVLTFLCSCWWSRACTTRWRARCRIWPR